MEEVDFVRDFKSGVRDYFTHKTEYSQVQAVLIAWSENDIGPEQELKDLRAVFEKDYQFSVSTFTIPNDGSSPGAKLNLEISSLVDTKCNHSDSLVIIYYAGHCSPDMQGNAEWAAFESGGPTLSWHITQQILFAARGDVLVLLDCCNASLLTRGTKEGGRFELLAASAKGAKTPVPGKKSFTRALIKELKKNAADGIDANELADRLREDDRITETPVFHNFVRKPSTRIRLRRLARETALDGKFVRKPAGYVVFRASLSDDVTGLEIADWLKTAAPVNVTAVDIELVITRARRLQGLLDGQGYADSSVFSRLSEPAKQEIVRQLQGLNTVMSTAEGDARDPNRAADRVSIEESIGRINSGVANVCSAVETPILLDLSQDSQSLEDDELVAAADAGPAILLRQAVRSHGTDDHDDGQLPRDSIKFIKATSKFKTGTIEQKTVIIETYKYRKNDDGELYEETKQQAKKMVSLLRHPKRTGFHILPCVGYYPDPLHDEIGLVFEAPPRVDPNVDFTSLMSLYKQERIVPLGHRIQLAWALATATEHFHRVGWVHKSIRSSNIAFSPEAGTKRPTPVVLDQSVDWQMSGSSSSVGPFDLSQPFLFGFEYSRPECAGTNMEEDDSLQNNLYRHPDRWWRPTAVFERHHDVYSLVRTILWPPNCPANVIKSMLKTSEQGVVLLEIALWKDVASIVHPKSGPMITNAIQVRDLLVGKCGKNLAHQVGEVLTRCILTCLNFEARTQGLREYDIQKYFQISVTGELGKAVGRI